MMANMFNGGDAVFKNPTANGKPPASSAPEEDNSSSDSQSTDDDDKSFL
jgi:hypothetical protein